MLPAVAATLLAAILSCKGGGGCPPKGGADGKETDPEPPPPPPPPPVADGTADGTAGQVPSPFCLTVPIDGESRARFQCAGKLEATLTLDVTVSGINVDQAPTPIDKDFGNGEDGDDYADPLVMACCADATEPFCSSGASQSCYLDLIQTSCQSLSVRINEKANEQDFPGPRKALEDLASYIASHQQECNTAFGETEVESTDPTCNPAGESSYGALLASRQWAVPGTFSGGTTDITNVLITVGQASITGAHPAGAGDADGCWSLEDNDDAPHFLEIFPPGLLIESN